MSDLVLTTSRILPLAPPDARSEPRILRFLVIAFAMTFLSVFVLLPLILVFATALTKGTSAYFDALSGTETLSAILLTLTTALISV
ncbi:MAG: sulfate/thiosulfate ABC transporter permease CysW, partial [Afipia sp.]|nr:sulfate/thiosulfate ABC transporter permease CysW [Afipia sp.]